MSIKSVGRDGGNGGTSAQANPHHNNSEAISVKSATLDDLYSGDLAGERQYLKDYQEPQPNQDIFASDAVSAKKVQNFSKEGCRADVISVADFEAEENRCSALDYTNGLEWDCEALPLMLGIARSGLLDRILRSQELPPSGENSSAEERLLHFAKTVDGDSGVELAPADTDDALQDAAAATLRYLVQFYLMDQVEQVNVCALNDSAPAGYSFSGEQVRFTNAGKYQAEASDSLTDKVASRLVAFGIGELKQPRFLDARDANRTSSFVSYSSLDLTTFPIDEVLQESSRKSEGWIVENMCSGFCVCKDNGELFVLTFNPRVLSLVTQFGLDVPRSDVSKETLHSFLQEVGKLPNLFIRPLQRTDGSGGKLNDTKAAEKLARFVLSHNGGPVYVKSARTSGGDAVVKVSRTQDGAVLLECNGGELQAAVESATSLARQGRDSNYIAFLRTRNAVALTPEGILARLIKQEMPTPIIEEGIDMALCDGGRAEPRIIYQCDDSGSLIRTGEYCKYSMSNVAANVALGGRGMALDEAIARILTPLVDSHELSTIALQSKLDLFAKCDAFARQWHSKSPSLYPEFAVDVGIVWNEKDRKLDFYLIEVQRKFAFEGLKEVDSAAAELVLKRREHMRALEQSEKPAPGGLGGLFTAVHLGDLLRKLALRPPNTKDVEVGETTNES